MYEPAHFAVSGRDGLHDFIEARPFGLLVTATSEGPAADPIPFLLAREEGSHGVLRAHVARANPLWRAHEFGRPVLAVFQDVDHYISPGWYPSKAETGRVVPTWNYALVQASGTMTVHEEPEWLRAQISALTEAHERMQTRSWRVEDAPEAYIAGQLRGIVGIEIVIEQLTGKFKVSQNRSDKDRAGVAAGLEAEGSMMASRMAQLVRAARGPV